MQILSHIVKKDWLRISQMTCHDASQKLCTPGTGESSVALTPGADAIYQGVLQQMVRAEGTANERPVKTAAMGLSFGGHWSTKLTMKGLVDCGINIGGPLGFTPFDAGFFNNLPYGMPGIIGNALRLARLPDDALVNTMFTGFSRKTLGLLDPGRKIPPLLAINGAQDQYIPRLETEGLRAFPSAEVWLVKGATHCAAEKLPRYIPAVIAWLRVQLHGDTAGNRLALAAGKALLPPLLNNLSEKSIPPKIFRLVDFPHCPVGDLFHVQLVFAWAVLQTLSGLSGVVPRYT
jgi:esterase FrsA